MGFGFWSRLKSMAGGGKDLPTIASAATVNVPDDNGGFYVSGSTTITSLLSASYLRNRAVTFIGASSAAVTFTNTNSPTTAGQMYLLGSDRLLNEDDVLELFCKNDGTWILLNTTIA